MAFYQEFRFCIGISDPDLLGDGVCQNYGNYNSAACEFDYGDCDDFNDEYPNCKAVNPENLNNSWCDGGLYDTEECGWDGGDCLVTAVCREVSKVLCFLYRFNGRWYVP